MRTTERMIDLDLATPRQSIATRFATGLYRVKSAWRALNNRFAANSLADLDDNQLKDIGLTRYEVKAILQSTRITEDPTAQLARSARKHSLQSLKPSPDR